MINDINLREIIYLLATNYKIEYSAVLFLSIFLFITSDSGLLLNNYSAKKFMGRT